MLIWSVMRQRKKLSTAPIPPDLVAQEFQVPISVFFRWNYGTFKGCVWFGFEGQVFDYYRKENLKSHSLLILIYINFVSLKIFVWSKTEILFYGTKMLISGDFHT